MKLKLDEILRICKMLKLNFDTFVTETNMTKCQKEKLNETHKYSTRKKCQNTFL